MEQPLNAFASIFVSSFIAHLLTALLSIGLVFLALFKKNSIFISCGRTHLIVCFALLGWFSLIIFNGGLNGFFHSIKTYFLPIFIFSFVLMLRRENPRIYQKMFDSIFLLVYLTGIYTVLEATMLISGLSTVLEYRQYYLHNTSLAENLSSIRPLGFHGMQVNSLIMALGLMLGVFCKRNIHASYISFFVKKTYFSLVLLALILSTGKTMILGVILFFIVNFIVRASVISYKVVRNIFVSACSFLVLVNFFNFESWIRYYQVIIFFNASQNKTVLRMIEKIEEWKFFLTENIVPVGYLDRASMAVIQEFPKYADTEVQLYALFFEYGFIGTFLIILSFSLPLILMRCNSVKVWSYLVFVVFFGLLHYWSIPNYFCFLLHSVIMVSNFDKSAIHPRYFRLRVVT